MRSSAAIADRSPFVQEDIFARTAYLIVVLTSRCNLRCRGCLQQADSFGIDMDDLLLEKVLQRVDDGRTLHIQITGGEPTLVPEKIKRLASVTRDFRVRPRLSLQTNGTLLSSELLASIIDNQIEVGLSLDGPPSLQQSLRGGCDATLRGMQWLEQENIPFRITTVVSAANIEQLHRMALLVAGFACCQGIGLDLLVQRGRGTGLKLPTAKALEAGVEKLAATIRLINRKRQQPIHLREYDLLTRKTISTAFCYGASGKSLAITPEGKLYPCGQTLNDPRFACGTVENPAQSIADKLGRPRGMARDAGLRNL
ncbi:MAG: hypothetical protein CSA21_06980 [Deltaproteobacteria bacterium]|nr:MAG: hypothetical protein CSA21_06980 [Deltaproteobacteria bacterium]